MIGNIGQWVFHRAFSKATTLKCDASFFAEVFGGLFPVSNARDTRFAINFFTAIGLGALTGAPILFGYPALFYLRGAARRGVRVALGDRVACAVFLAVCLPLFTVLGTADAVREIASGWGEDPAGPFACAANRTASLGGLSDGA